MRPIRCLSTGLLAAVLAVGAHPAAAQQQQRPQGQAPEQRVQMPPPAGANNWLKVCNEDTRTNKNVCLVTNELRTPQGQFLASVAIREEEGVDDRRLLLSVPVGMMIQPGVQLQVDGAEPLKAPYQICFPNACYAEARIKNAVINKFKAGNVLRLIALNQQAQAVPFQISLVGFTATYDSKGLNPQELATRNQQLEEQLNKRAAEARQRLIDAQRQQPQQSN